MRAWLLKRGWKVTRPFVWQGDSAETRLDLSSASRQTKGQMQHNCRQQWRLWCFRKFLLGKRHEAREFRSVSALPALLRQAEDIDLERLREFAREYAEGRSVLLGAAVSPAWLAHCSQVDPALFVCPCCGAPRASWYHMAWHCPARPKVPIPANIFQRRFGWPLKSQTTESARAILEHMAAAVRLLWQQRHGRPPE